MSLERPDPSEHAPYYRLYIDQAPEGDILSLLQEGLDQTLSTLGGLSPDQETYRYAPDKWSIREIVGHLIDTEWTFAYRGLCFARTDPASLPGFDQDLWARASIADRQPLADLLATFAQARQSSLAIFRSFDDAAWLRRGVASEVSFTVRTMPYILAGHEIHHLAVIADRYLGSAEASP